MTAAALWLSLALHGFAVAVAYHLRFARRVRALNLPLLLFFASTFLRRVVALDHGPSPAETACWNLVHSGLLALWALRATRAVTDRHEESYQRGRMDGLESRQRAAVEAMSDKEDA